MKPGAILPSCQDDFNDIEREIYGLEPGWAKNALSFRGGNRYGHKENIRCLSLIDVYEHLEVFRARFDKGDTLALLQGIATCAEENVPLPSWLAEAYRGQINKLFQQGQDQVYSLEEAFQSPDFPTNTPKKVAQKKQLFALGAKLWKDLWSLVREDASVTSFDNGITRLLAGGKYGVKKTKAKELIIMVESNQLQFTKGTSLSDFLAKRRKLAT